MLICRKCGARLADQSKICYCCKTPVTPETVDYYDPFAEDQEADEEQRALEAAAESPARRASSRNQDPSGRYRGQDFDAKSGSDRQQAGNDGMMPHGYGEAGTDDGMMAHGYDPSDFWGNLDREQQNAYQAPTDEMLYIGPGAELYIPKFRDMQEKKRLFAWNWAAFLGGPAWFAYRKMYGMSIFLLVGNLFLAFLPYYIWAAIAVDVLLGLLGDSIYMNHIARLVAKGRKLPREAHAKHIRRFGGVSLAYMLVLFAVYEVLLMLIPG